MDQTPISSTPNINPISTPSLPSQPQKTRSFPVKNIVIAALSVLVIAMGVYIVIGLINKPVSDAEVANNSSGTGDLNSVPTPISGDDNPAIKEENAKAEPIDINNPLVQYLFETFRLDGAIPVSSVDEWNNSNLAKLRLIYNNVPLISSHPTSCSDFANFKTNSYCGTSMSLEMEEAYVANDWTAFHQAELYQSTDSVDKDVFEIAARRLFGSNFEIKHEDFGLSTNLEPICVLMHWDSNKQLYAKYSGECGGVYVVSEHKLVSASKKGDELYLETTWAGGNLDENAPRTPVHYTFKYDPSVGTYVFQSVSES